MKKIKIMILLFSAFCLQNPAFANCKSWIIKTKQGKTAIFKCHKGCLSDNPFSLEILANIYSAAFANLYAKNEDELNKMKNYFYHELTDPCIENKNFVKELNEQLNANCITVKIENKTVGYALFLDNFPKEILPYEFDGRKLDDYYKNPGKILKENEKYLFCIAIHPKAQKQGLAKHLIFAILKAYPKTKRIVFFNDKINNQKACNIFSHLGFKSYNETKLEYNPNKSTVMEWVNPK